MSDRRTNCHAGITLVLLRLFNDFLLVDNPNSADAAVASFAAPVVVAAVAAAAAASAAADAAVVVAGIAVAVAVAVDVVTTAVTTAVAVASVAAAAAAAAATDVGVVKLPVVSPSFSSHFFIFLPLCVSTLYSFLWLLLPLFSPLALFLDVQLLLMALHY